MTTPKSTQSFVPIEEVRDGVVVLKDGSLRAVLIASSINFALKSRDEQQGLLLQYQNFLNSLDFYLQIFVQSRRLDIRPYISILEERLKSQTNDLLKVQTQEYIEFIKSFTENNNIMTKSFFVVIPYTPPIIQNRQGWWIKLFKRQPAKTVETLAFEEERNQLEQRVDVVRQGLGRLGVRVELLGTEELVELYFKAFNPGEVNIPETV
ncbi:MAG: hypothetical protein HYV76_02960 [Candidatus Vogelbacteria bacterium]|nr:hypothetical protein [Candidatus Vogelbacteria bacterium]